MTDARRQADEALARWHRLEAAVHALQSLTDAERTVLPGVLPDVGDLAVLGAALRCERAHGVGSSQFTAAFGLARTWRSAARRGRVRDLLASLPSAITVADIRQRMVRLEHGRAARDAVDRQL